ncbi:unnamed protein product [Echinostoma caproni]|uniref:CRISPR-associated protein Cas1 n=1 Tax=Echinostoma caproni TaxID=27848 RepID=A0A183B4J5_9TREM|nr:unnamed protein product [Echinostoma caproni]
MLRYGHHLNALPLIMYFGTRIDTCNALLLSQLAERLLAAQLERIDVLQGEGDNAERRHLGTFRYYLVPQFANKRLRLPRVFLSTSGNETLGGCAHFQTRKKTYRKAVNSG